MSHPRRILSVILLCATFGVFSATAAAQSVEIFGGYQYTHLQPAFNASGWNAAFTKNFKHVLGITGDVSGAYQHDRSAYTYTVGPVVTARLPGVQPFFHALFGGISTQNSDDGFAMFLGAGLDVGFRKGIGIRVVQLDWLHTDVADAKRDRNLRASAGIVLKF